MDNQRNLLLAVVLSALLLLGWELGMSQFFPEADAPAEQVQSAGPASASPATPANLDDADVGAMPVVPLESALATPGRIRIDAPEVLGSINPVGARIDDIDLKTHRQAVAEDSGPVRLFAPAGTPDQQYARFGWDGDGVTVPDANTRWQLLEGERLTQATPVTLGWNNPAGQQFRLKFAIDDHYMITVTQTVANAGDAAVTLAPYAMVSRTSANAAVDSFNVHSGPIRAVDAAVDFEWNYDDVTEAGTVPTVGATNWIGFTDVYWMSALIPDAGQQTSSMFRAQGEDRYRAELVYQPITLAPGRSVTRTTRLFAGAKESAVLDDYEAQGVTRFGLAIDWGWFRFLAWPIWQVLIFLFGLTGNFGVAIICLTVIVRAIMFPVAQKQFASMAQLRVVQPKMKAIQDRYKDDKEKLQQEMAKLYKEEGVNPLAGCLPIFLQIPIFFALYKTLLLAIEMRHEPFFGWMRDLSAPDTATLLNLFGYLDFTPPGFLAIGVLGVLLGFTMWLQFKLQPAAVDPMQQQIFAIMPWVLMFVMAAQPSGLLVYWITSNILTLAQQKYFYSKHPQLKAQADKTAADKTRSVSLGKGSE